MKTLAVFVILGLFVFLAQGAPYGDEDNHKDSSEETHSDLDHKSKESEGDEGHRPPHHPPHHGGKKPPHHGGKKPHHHGGHRPHHNKTKPYTKPPHHHKEHEKDGKKDSFDENSMAAAQAQKKECTDGEECEEKHHGKERMVRLAVPIAVGLLLLIAGLGLGFLIFRKCRNSRSSKIPFEKFDEKPPVLVQNMTYGVTPSKDISEKE